VQIAVHAPAATIALDTGDQALRFVPADRVDAAPGALRKRAEWW